MYAIALAFAHLAMYAILANIEVGVGYTGGPRDKPPVGLSVHTQRMGRAYANCVETLPWFGLAMITAHLGQKVDAAVITAGWVYLAARIAYVPAYLFPVSLLRSAIWSLATAAILFIVFRALS